MPSPPAFAPDFRTTRWSLVASALLGDAADPDLARQRLVELCLRYWYPVYVYLRRSGHAPQIAQHMTAEFFADLLHYGPQRAAGMPQGRFRLFLLTELHRFLSHDRGGGDTPAEILPPLSLDELESRQRADHHVQGSPDLALHRGFALEIIGHALAQLRSEAHEAGRLTMFEALQGYLGSEPQPGDYDVEARRLGVRPLFVALAVKRLRQRFRELVEDELSQTVSDADDLEGERAALHAAVADTQTGTPV